MMSQQVIIFGWNGLYQGFNHREANCYLVKFPGLAGYTHEKQFVEMNPDVILLDCVKSFELNLDREGFLAKLTIYDLPNREQGIPNSLLAPTIRVSIPPKVILLPAVIQITRPSPRIGEAFQ